MPARTRAALKLPRGHAFHMNTSKLYTLRVLVQLSKGLAGVSKEEMAKITIAYEPVWAIGTGLTGTKAIYRDAFRTHVQVLCNTYPLEFINTTRL